MSYKDHTQNTIKAKKFAESHPITYDVALKAFHIANGSEECVNYALQMSVATATPLTTVLEKMRDTFTLQKPLVSPSSV